MGALEPAQKSQTDALLAICGRFVAPENAGSSGPARIPGGMHSHFLPRRFFGDSIRWFGRREPPGCEPIQQCNGRPQVSSRFADGFAQKTTEDKLSLAVIK